MSGPFFLTQWERDDYERSKRGEPARGPSGASLEPTASGQRKMSEQYFTVVFAGDLRKLGKNPFKITSDFGEAISVAFGDALEELDEYRDEAVSRSPQETAHD